MSRHKINGGLVAFPTFHVGADVLFGSPLVEWLDFDCGAAIVEDGMVTGRMVKGIKLREEGKKVHLAEFLAELAALVALAPEGTEWGGHFVVKGKDGRETLYCAKGKAAYAVSEAQVNAEVTASVIDAMLRTDVAVYIQPRACGAVYCRLTNMDGETEADALVGHHGDMAENRLDAILRASESYLRAREATVKGWAS
jgi:hypothetical protein